MVQFSIQYLVPLSLGLLGLVNARYVVSGHIYYSLASNLDLAYLVILWMQVGSP